MRQVVVLEPAGSVLVIRQTSLGSGSGNVGVNSTGTNDTHALVNHAVPTIASNDHNQNRIVVVRSSTSSTCMTNSADNHTSTNGNSNINVNANINGNPGGINCKPSSKVGVGGGVCKPNERNDHLRNEHKTQDGIVNSNETNPAAGCRPRTSKEAAHENVASDRKLDGADPISGRVPTIRYDMRCTLLFV
ncbi:calmodulin-binding transcription activator [Lasius niger]|uniref:Calmodulin-binding transcription activator n=1 Tax=Lasius niger TaxID=67767 RepID=A0A0J7KUQ2_LASNI|nr:calmodulin-binding transcription activator [Lasius niger]